MRPSNSVTITYRVPGDVAYIGITCMTREEVDSVIRQWKSGARMLTIISGFLGITTTLVAGFVEHIDILLVE